MAVRHYGYDISVIQVGSSGLTNVIGTFENMDFSYDPIVKESQAAQDTGPNRRSVGADFTLSLNKFLEGNNDDMMEYCMQNTSDITLTITFTVPTPNVAPGSGVDWHTLTLNNCVCTKIGRNFSGEPTKDSYEFKRGSGLFAFDSSTFPAI
jgi:hypothetical protein